MDEEDETSLQHKQQASLQRQVMVAEPTAQLVLVGLQVAAVVFFQCGTQSVLQMAICLSRT